jgi:hypothetical protein
LIEGALGLAFIHNMPCTVDESVVREAVLKADALGQNLRGSVGDSAYRRLQA